MWVAARSVLKGPRSLVDEEGPDHWSLRYIRCVTHQQHFLLNTFRKKETLNSADKQAALLHVLIWVLVWQRCLSGLFSEGCPESQSLESHVVSVLFNTDRDRTRPCLLAFFFSNCYHASSVLYGNIFQVEQHWIQLTINYRYQRINQNVGRSYWNMFLCILWRCTICSLRDEQALEWVPTYHQHRVLHIRSVKFPGFPL